MVCLCSVDKHPTKVPATEAFGTEQEDQDLNTGNKQRTGRL